MKLDRTAGALPRARCSSLCAEKDLYSPLLHAAAEATESAPRPSGRPFGRLPPLNLRSEERIDDRYTSRSHLTGVGRESDLRTDAVRRTAGTRLGTMGDLSKERVLFGEDSLNGTRRDCFLPFHRYREIIITE